MGSSREHGPGWRVLHLVPLTLTLVPVPVCAALAFLYAAVRGRSKRWGWVAAGYGFGGLLLFPLLAVPFLCVAVWLAAWIGAMVYAFRIRHELLERAQAVSEAFGGGTTWISWSPPAESVSYPSLFPVVEAPDGEEERRRQERIAALRSRSDAEATALRGRPVPASSLSSAPQRVVHRRCAYCGGKVEEQDHDCRACGAPA